MPLNIVIIHKWLNIDDVGLYYIKQFQISNSFLITID